MSFDPHLAAIRFGTGLSPVIPLPAGVDDMLNMLRGPDLMASAYPVAPFTQTTPTPADYQRVNAARREPATRDAAQEEYRAMNAQVRLLQHRDFGATFARGVRAKDGLRERLVWFWTNHFTVRSRGIATLHLVTPFVEEAIRPHIMGDFATLLRAAVTHPMMVAYLDQSQSYGPNSPRARGGRGLNENLAREVLELHTLGVDGPYSQDDVIQFAEALTGLFWPRGVMASDYRPDQAEPGAETVLGVTYPPEADLSVIHAVLDDLARHPATARHLAWKMARHFVSDTPDPDLVAAMAAAYGQGDLDAMVSAMLSHPAAWIAQRGKVRLPFEFMTAAVRALDVAEDKVIPERRGEGDRHFRDGLALMGQPWQSPPDPAGWSDLSEAWVTAQFLAARIDWAMRIPARLNRRLPDPRDFAVTALGSPPQDVTFAAGAAEDRLTGIGVVLASSAFQRR